MKRKEGGIQEKKETRKGAREEVWKKERKKKDLEAFRTTVT